MNRRKQPISVQQAAQDSPTFARLSSLAADSTARLRSVQFLIPFALRTTIKAGPIDGSVWCLILESSAAASKLRHLLPALEAHLRSKGWDVQSIRLKVQTPQSYV